MSVMFPTPMGGFGPMASAQTFGTPSFGSIGIQRLPTDPLFYATLTLDNIVVGSRYRITRASTGTQLATGVAAATTEVLTGLPAYVNPMQVNITVRNASGSPVYKVFDTAAFLVKAGAAAYILQQID